MPAQAEQEQKDELPVESVPPAPAAPASPEATSSEPLATPHVPPAAPPTSEASITISAMEFRAMIHLFKTLTAMHNSLFRQMVDIRTQHNQHTAILRRIQQHLGLLPPPYIDIPGPSEAIAPAEETNPAKETIRVNVSSQATHKAATDPSSPSESPAT